MKIFITGIAGFLGSHLAEHYLDRGHVVAGVDNMLGADPANLVPGAVTLTADCNQPDAYRHLIAGSDIVYHCAAAPYEGLSVNSPRLVWEHTLMSTVSVLSAGLAGGIGRFVLCSSMARYGAQPHPFKETMPPAPVDPYGTAKHAAELAARNLCELHRVDWTIAVPHNIYGPRQRYVDPYRNVISIMINRILQGKPPVIYGDGSQRRCFSYIDDVIGPLTNLGELPAAVGEVFNVGPDDEGVTISELAELLLGQLGSPLRPVHFAGRPHEVQEATCSAAKARRLLGYEPKWTLEQGLAELIEWIRSRGPRPFEYHLPIEIPTPDMPATWTQRLI